MVLLYLLFAAFWKDSVICSITTTCYMKVPAGKIGLQVHSKQFDTFTLKRSNVKK